ncbi:hypothetical protein D3C76_1187840 [compost metagenome]
MIGCHHQQGSLQIMEVDSVMLFKMKARQLADNIHRGEGGQSLVPELKFSFMVCNSGQLDIDHNKMFVVHIPFEALHPPFQIVLRISVMVSLDQLAQEAVSHMRQLAG